MKKFDMTKQALLICLMFFSTSLFAQNLNFDDFDLDNDGWVEKDEFKAVFIANYWDDWNPDDDENLDEDDFYTFTYAIIDVDDDELLTPEEWVYGYDYYYGDYLVDDFVAYDVDGDGYLEYAEYYDVLYDTDFYATWDIDMDTYLSKAELAENVFELWDTNDTGLMSKSEFNNFKKYYDDI